ncbi:ComEC/Rec2 family competence protein [Anaerocellum danielii]|uniref:Uncharacterized protein n=1 Tax=Anaerocellum danielii TaxID=1387557 RepID=A0ABZ0U198_9FIRM|nr:hypothetical protein [Caldicellulosiruptor danielii]WPX09501.1 hypothetical protein SOJ16_000713 [Caldicellulosiruptor danielii]
MELPEEGYIKEPWLGEIDIYDAESIQFWNDAVPLNINGNKGIRGKSKYPLIKIKLFNYTGVEGLEKFRSKYKYFKNRILSILGCTNKHLLNRIIKERKILRKEYSKWIKEIDGSRDLNRTSLCIFINDRIGIINRRIRIHKLKGNNYYCSNNCFKPVEIIIHQKRSFNSLFTGNIDLSRRKIREQFIKNLNLATSKKDIDLYVVPHHGSIHNWSDKILAYCDKLALILLPITCSYFSRNKTHPSKEVVKRIKKRNFFELRI